MHGKVTRGRGPGTSVPVSELGSAKYSPYMSQSFSDAHFREVTNALQGWRRISQFTAQPPHLAVWGLWEGETL